MVLRDAMSLDPSRFLPRRLGHLAGLGLAASLCTLVFVAAPAVAQNGRGPVMRPSPLPNAAAQPAASKPAIDPVRGVSGPAGAVPANPVVATSVPIEPLNARLIIRLEQAERGLAEVLGRVEELEAQIAGQKEENRRLARALDETRAQSLAEASRPPLPGPPVLAGTGANTLAAPTTLASAPLQAMSAKDESEAAQAAGAPASMGPTGDADGALPKPIVPADIMLNRARAALARSAYTDAERQLGELVRVHPASAEANEAHWLLGETRFVQSAWGPAAQAYLAYLNAAPNGPRANEALIRLAGAFGQIGNNTQRCAALAEYKRRAVAPDPTLKARADTEIARQSCPQI